MYEGRLGDRELRAQPTAQPQVLARAYLIVSTYDRAVSRAGTDVLSVQLDAHF